METKPEHFIQQLTTEKQVKIVSFVTVNAHGSNLPAAEKLLAELLSDGWHVVASGAAGGDPGLGEGSPWANGYVILAREIVDNW